jgi:hypothetical protein
VLPCPDDAPALLPATAGFLLDLVFLVYYILIIITKNNLNVDVDI